MIAPLDFSSIIGDGDFLERLLVAQNTMKMFSMCKIDARIMNLNKQTTKSQIRFCIIGLSN